MREKRKKVKIYAHRGAHQGAPENSLAAMELAALVGVRYIELDVQLTRDGRLVVTHDEAFQGGSKRVDKMDLAQLTEAVIMNKLGPSFSEEKIPCFEQYMSRLQNTCLIPNMELKVGRDAKQLACKTTKYLLEHWPSDRELRVSSFSFEALKACRAAGYTGEIALLSSSFKAINLQQLEELRACAYHVKYKKIKPQEMALIKEKGYELLSYTINSKAGAEEFLAAGGDGFFTDDLLLMDEF